MRLNIENFLNNSIINNILMLKDLIWIMILIVNLIENQQFVMLIQETFIFFGGKLL